MTPRRSHHFDKKDLLLKYQQQKQQTQQLQDRALAEATRCATLLYRDFEAEQVYLFGPLCYGAFREGMPLELAVEGLSYAALASARARFKQSGAFEIELTDLAQVDGWTRRTILHKGRLL